METVAHISDIHLVEKRHFAPSLSVLKRLIGQLKEKKPSVIALTGDLVGSDQYHRLTYAERIYWAGLMRGFSEVAPLVVVAGNHDNPSELRLFQHCSSVHPIKIVTSMESFVIGRILFHALPWMPLRDYGADHTVWRQGADPAVLENIKQHIDNANQQYTHMEYKYRVILAHMPVWGIKVGSYELESVRDVYLTREFLGQIDYDYVGLGHIHAQQEIAPRAYYAGSLFPLSIDDQAAKGYMWVDLEEKEYTFQPVESWRLKEIRCAWDGSKMEPDPMGGLSRTECEDAYFRLVISVPPGTNPKTLPIELIQQTIMRYGGGWDGVRLSPQLSPGRGASATQSPSALHPQNFPPLRVLLETRLEPHQKPSALARYEELNESRP